MKEIMIIIRVIAKWFASVPLTTQPVASWKGLHCFQISPLFAKDERNQSWLTVTQRW